LLRDTLRKERRGKRPEWLRAEAVPAMLQLLTHEDAPVRMMLVEMLADIPERPATVALAQRAVFDLDAQVRETAIKALEKRKAEDYRPVLLRGLRYPWVPAAEHTAEALVALKDKGAVPNLVSLLDQPDPAGPQLHARSKRTFVQEVVRINHVTNCVMCHPPAATGTEPCLGVDPILGLAPGGKCNPTQVTVGGQLLATPGANGYRRQVASSTPLLLRGDITFLRQDFSVNLPVAGPAMPPVRFDYVVRTVVLSPKEVALRKERVADQPTNYPQRDAVLFALRHLTGKDEGPTTIAWKKRYPHAEEFVKAGWLAKTLVQANPIQREFLLKKYRTDKGLEYTWALARAIPQLNSKAQEPLRAILIERMASLGPAELQERLRDDDSEVRQAAQRAQERRRDDRVARERVEWPGLTGSTFEWLAEAERDRP
jgi:hypothetical protein